MRSLATRLSLRFAGVFAALLVLVVGFTSFIIVVVANKSAQEAVAEAEGDIHQLTQLYAAEGKPLALSAPTIVATASGRHVRIAIFDGAGRLLAGDGTVTSPPTPRYFDRFDILGGSVAIAPADNVGAGVLAYWILMFFVGGLGLLVAWLVGRYLATQSLRPVADVTNALSKLAGGDFSRRTFVMEERSEVGSLASAFNAAVDKVASVFAQRDATETRMRQFIADAGHELRTPLTVVMGYVDVLRRGAMRDEALATRILETMTDEGGRMRSLVDKLLTLARLEDVAPPQAARIDVGAMLGDIVASMRTSAPNAHIVLRADPEVVVVADEAELRSAVVNLIDNALKYAPGVPVDVVARAAGDSVEIVVADGGPGMSEQERASAFDRFYRGDNRGDATGAGLGLAIVKRSIERANGTVELETTPGLGTRVTLRLPRLSV
jgi:two-component system, OmpR family, sensor kinase